VDKKPWWPVAVGLGALVVVGGGGGFWWWKNGTSAAKPATATTPLAARLAPFRKSCPEGMVFVPAGTFTMGSPDGEGGTDEHPAHPATLEAFCIGGTEVTVAAYSACVRDKRGDLQCTAPRKFASCNTGNTARAQHPVNCVDWAQAETYCKWSGGALPTEAQWEYAARGTDGRKFPWGNEPPVNSRLNACGRECADAHSKRKAMYDKSDKFTETAPVGSFPEGASPFGALDMAGNVSEWVADLRAPYPGGPAFVIEPGGIEPTRTVRGGTYMTSDPDLVRVAARQGLFGTGVVGTGFRCVQKP